jgi:hypothetical protein
MSEAAWTGILDTSVRTNFRVAEDLKADRGQLRRMASAL